MFKSGETIVIQQVVIYLSRQMLTPLLLSDNANILSPVRYLFCVFLEIRCGKNDFGYNLKNRVQEIILTLQKITAKNTALKKCCIPMVIKVAKTRGNALCWQRGSLAILLWWFFYCKRSYALASIYGDYLPSSLSNACLSAQRYRQGLHTQGIIEIEKKVRFCFNILLKQQL